MSPTIWRCSDAHGHHATVFIAPDRPPRVEPWLVSANRQAEDARPDEPSVQDSALREAVVQARLSDPGAGLEQIVQSFLTEPVWRDPALHGWGTLYTACYRPAERSLELRWHGNEWRQSVAEFTPGRAHDPLSRGWQAPRAAGAGGSAGLTREEARSA